MTVKFSAEIVFLIFSKLIIVVKDRYFLIIHPSMILLLTSMKCNPQSFTYEMLTNKDSDIFHLVKERCYFLDYGNVFVNIGNIT